MSGTEAKDEAGLSYKPEAFEALEKDFQEVLQSLVGDRSLEKFRKEYEKVHAALKKSHENEKLLVKKVKELNNEIVTNAATVATALKLSEDDDTTITSLKRQIERAWAMVEQSHERELAANDTIQRLQGEIANLTKLVETHTGMLGQDSTVGDLLKVREVLKRKNEEAAATNASLQEQKDVLLGKIDKKRNKNREKKAVIAELRDAMAQKQVELEREGKRKERVEKELKSLKAKMEARIKQSATLTAAIRDGEQQKAQLDEQLANSKKTIEKYLRDFDVLYKSARKVTDQLRNANMRVTLLQEGGAELERDLKTKTDEANKAHSEAARLQRHLDSEKKRSKRLLDKVEEEKLAQNELKAEIASLNNELDAAAKRLQEKDKKLTSVERSAQVEERKARSQAEKARDNREKFEAGERAVHHLENKITGYRNEAIKSRNILYQLEKDREKYGIQAAEAQTKFLQATEEVKLKEAQMQELEKKEAEVRARLKHQQQMYEAVRADRNMYSKHLIEAQDEIAEMKRKFKIMTHQIEQLKEEITVKDRALVAVHFDHQADQKKLEQLQHEVDRLNRAVADSDADVKKHNAVIGELNATIRRMDEDSLQQRKNYDQVVAERDILGTQLIRRNDELALVYEKLKIHQSTLQKGEAQYRDRLQDIRILKLKLGDLRRELAIAKNQAGKVGDLQKEVMRLQKELLQEKTKVKALSEELENPMNVHRWRKLEGSDPATYEMIQKIQTLQKRLIAKTEEAVDKELTIQEKTKMVEDLKNILARQPGPEVAEQLSALQQALKEKQRQMKAMASELNMSQAQINEYKYEIERLTRQLREAKRTYYELKRRLQMAETTMGSTSASATGTKQAKMQRTAAEAATARFTGGGFNIQAS